MSNYRLLKIVRCNNSNHIKVGEYIDQHSTYDWGPFDSVNKAYKRANEYMEMRGGCGCNVEVVEEV